MFKFSKKFLKFRLIMNSLEFWMKIFNSMFFVVFDRIIELFMTMGFQNQSNMIQTPKFNTFDTPKLSKGLLGDKNKDEKERKGSVVGIKINPANEKQWEETIKIMIPSFAKILKKFFAVAWEK